MDSLEPNRECSFRERRNLLNKAFGRLHSNTLRLIEHPKRTGHVSAPDCGTVTKDLFLELIWLAPLGENRRGRSKRRRESSLPICERPLETRSQPATARQAGARF